MNTIEVSKTILQKIANLNFLEMENFITMFIVNPKQQCDKIGIVLDDSLSNEDINEIAENIAANYKKFTPSFTFGGGFTFSNELKIQNPFIRDFVYQKIMDLYEGSLQLIQLKKTLEHSTDNTKNEIISALAGIGFTDEICEYLYTTIDIHSISDFLDSLDSISENHQKEKKLSYEQQLRKQKIQRVLKKSGNNLNNAPKLTSSSFKGAMTKSLLTDGLVISPIIKEFLEAYNALSNSLAGLGFSDDEIQVVKQNPTSILDMLEQKERLNL